MRVTKECPACDGEGSLSTQWAKSHCVEVGGYAKRMTDNCWLERNIPYTFMAYYTPDHREIEHKTIGSSCSMCNGKGEIEVEEEEDNNASDNDMC